MIFKKIRGGWRKFEWEMEKKDDQKVYSLDLYISELVYVDECHPSYR